MGCRGNLEVMKPQLSILSVLLFMVTVSTMAEDYKANFGEPLDDGWSFVREDKKEWRLADGHLELLAQPSNIWGTRNRGTKNLLLRALPGKNSSVEVVVDFVPGKKYEQAGLILYVDDDNYVKLNRELLDGQFCVMILESEAKPVSVKRMPFRKGPVHLRLDIAGDKVTASIKAPDSAKWIEHGNATLPGKIDTKRIGLFSLMGDATTPRWAKFSQFKLSAGK